MRTSNFFKSIVTVALGTVISMGAFAQGLTTKVGATLVPNGSPSITTFGAADATHSPEFVDLVTVGSKTPYVVTPDANVAAMVTGNPAVFKASVYNWSLAGAAATGSALEIPAAHTGLTADGNADGTPTYANFFNENSVGVQWGSTTGACTISVSEQSQNTAGLPACDGALENLNVWVMPRPTVNFDEAATPTVNGNNIIGTASDGIIGGCGVAAATSTDVLLAFDISGSDQYQVAYKVDYYALADFTTPATSGTSTFTATPFDDGTNTFLSVTAGSPNSVTGITNNQIKVSVPDNSTTAAYGKWVITLTAVNDRIYRKSFNTTAGDVANDGTVLNSGGAVISTLTLYSLPTPTTGKIQHVTNLGW